ncbi:MAG: glutathione S-transferase [Gammaproteobacteria bacterium]|nr:glutathione S-transferase [Gammaproteobacteria bacterium]MDH3372826.1 glutathione S-transferase [Gammaproteobacteria bacterium]MDH3407980.1 glutathione S-transferase [Gammaproteobacteria bacterium]MDH3551295.1 glutathione S-transferase [Gammaproteobacteria bacterium]
MLTVHHLENSRSQRILWLLEELGADYEIKRYGRDKVTSLAPPELRAIHPLGKSPVITDGDATIAESGAIIEYLLAKFDTGTLLPSHETPEHRAYIYWLHYAEGTFAPLMLLSVILARIESAPMPFFLKPVAKGIAGKVRDNFLDANVKRNLDFMESELQHSTWFCGDHLTGADIQMSFAVEAAEVRTDLEDNYPRLAAFLERVRARPAYKRALDKGGHYELMGINKN